MATSDLEFNSAQQLCPKRGSQSEQAATESSASFRARNTDTLDWPIAGTSCFSRSARGMPRGDDRELGLCAAEIRRRCCHMLPGVLAFLLPLIPHEHPLPSFMVLHVTALATVLALGVILIFSKIARPNEQNWVLNIISYPATILLTLMLFPGHPEFSAVVLVVLAFGDGSATLFGLCLGRRSLPWNAKKTWVGSLAFLVCAAPLSAVAYWVESEPHVPVGLAVAVGFLSTGLAGMAESLPWRVSDNLRVGLAAMVGVVTAHIGLMGWL